MSTGSGRCRCTHPCGINSHHHHQCDAETLPPLIAIGTAVMGLPPSLGPLSRTLGLSGGCDCGQMLLLL